MASSRMSRNLYVIAGPNGAGKTTFARAFLPEYAVCRNFVNADLIAEGLSPLSPEAASFRAGRLMIDEIHRLADRGEDFGFETTLAGRAHLNLLAQLKPKGCVVHMFCFRPQKRRFRESGLAFGEADMMYRKRPFAGALSAQSKTSCAYIAGQPTTGFSSITPALAPQ